MYKKVLFAALIFKVGLVFCSWAQENIFESEAGTIRSSVSQDAAQSARRSPNDRTPNIKKYVINFYLRIFDHEDNVIVDSTWSRIARSGQSVSVNLRANNLNLAVVFVPYFVNENSIMLLSKSRIVLKHADYSGGKYYSVVDSIPLKLGEKALFFPLGILDEKIENISFCVLEIEVVYYDEN